MLLPRRPATLVTGGSGFLGALTIATLLVEDERDVIVPLRGHHDREQVLWHIQFGLSTLHAELTPRVRERIHFVPLPPPEHLGALEASIPGLLPVEIFHCAGCLDYFDKANLEAINIGLTARTIDLAQRWRTDRYTYLSTAYASGYVDGVAPEALHDEPHADPTDYTRTKRAAERLVATSGLTFQVLRPSIVVGHSQSGAYTGKRYGLYQLWNGMERLLCKKWIPVLHVVAPKRKLSLLHQDAYQWALLAVRRRRPEAPFVHLSSRHDSQPTMREVWDSWNQACMRARELVYYDHVDEVPLREIDTRQRAFLSLAWANLQIASRHWQFATDHVEALRVNQPEFADVTMETVELCQRRFIEESETIRRFIELYHRSPQ